MTQGGGILKDTNIVGNVSSPSEKNALKWAFFLRRTRAARAQGAQATCALFRPVPKKKNIPVQVVFKDNVSIYFFGFFSKRNAVTAYCLPRPTQTLLPAP
jgi:hypothetical protein